MEKYPDRFWFKCSLFEIEPGEDEAINPGIYGKQLANWLAEKLHAQGYQIEIIEEDWGRCLICFRKPVQLWIGCANVATSFPNLPAAFSNPNLTSSSQLNPNPFYSRPFAFIRG